MRGSVGGRSRHAFAPSPGGGAAAFSIAGLNPLLYLDAASATVSQWDDELGGSGAFSQDTATNQPVVQSLAAFNDNTVVSFDGTDNYLQEDSTTFGNYESGAFAGVAVLRINDTDRGRVIGKRGSAGSAYGWQVEKDTGNAINFVISGTSALASTQKTSFVPPTGVLYLYWYYDGATSMAIYVDGETAGVSTVTAPGDASNTVPMGIGARVNALGFFSNLDLAKVILFDRVPTQTELDDLSGDLNTTYGRVGYSLNAAFSGELASGWATTSIDSDLNGADGQWVADIDGDGSPDVVAVAEDVGDVAYYPSGDAYAKTLLDDDAGSVEGAWIADVNADSQLDVVAFSEDQGIYLYLLDGTTQAVTSTVRVEDSTDGTLWLGGQAFDMDGDGDLDILAHGRGDGELAWYENDGTYADAWTQHVIGTTSWSMGAHAVDLDADGDVDVVATDRAGDTKGFGWWRNDGSGTWVYVPIDDQSRDARMLSYGDFDSDGDLDFATVYETSSADRIVLFERTGATSFTAHESPTPITAGQIQAVEVGEIDGDAVPELVITFANSAAGSGVFWGDGAAVFGTTWTWSRVSDESPDNEKWDQPTLTDFDGDGDLDILVTEQNVANALKWFENVESVP